VNADLIAQGLSPFSPRVFAIKAGRIVLEQINGRPLAVWKNGKMVRISANKL